MNPSSTTDRPRFRLQARAWGLISLCLAPSASALTVLPPGTSTSGTQPTVPAATRTLTYQGVLSAIDIGAKPGAVKEAGRASGLNTTLGGEEVLPLVELIHMQNLLDCRASKGDSKTVPGTASQTPSAACNSYEWSVPFIPEANARALEQELSLAWNDFDAKSTWYMNSLLNAKPDPGVLSGVTDKLPEADWDKAQDGLKRLLPATQGRSLSGNCSANAKAQTDLYLGAWSGKDLAASIGTKLFCDDVLKAIKDALPSYVPGVQCLKLPAATKWKVVGDRLTQGYGQAIGEYYPQYWQRVYAAIERYMPGSLAWDGVYPITGAVGTQGGVQLQPIYAAGPQIAQYQELAKKAQAKVPGSGFLLVKRLPNAAVVASSQSQSALQSKVPAPAPNAGIGSSWPGIPKLEVLKYNLANREDIFARADQWWSKAAAPRGRSGAGDLRESERFGAVSFIQLYSQVDKLSSPRGVEYNRWCFVGYAPVLVKLAYPNIASGINSMLGGLTRVHVRYESAPEGYPLHYVKGQPSRNLGTLQAALSARLPSIAGLPKIDALKWPSTQTLIQEAAKKATDETLGLVASLPPTSVASTSPKPSTGKKVPMEVPMVKPTVVSAEPAEASSPQTKSNPAPKAPATKAPATKATAQKATAQPTKSTPQSKAVKFCEAIETEILLRMCLATKILDDPRITLGTFSSTPLGSPLNNMKSAATNMESARGCGSTSVNCGKTVFLDNKLLTGMLKMASNGSRYTVTAITGGGHGGPAGSSYHYTGQALDIGSWTDATTKQTYFLGTPNIGHTLASKACMDAGSSGTLNAYSDKNHKNHVHCNFR